MINCRNFYFSFWYATIVRKFHSVSIHSPDSLKAVHLMMGSLGCLDSPGWSESPFRLKVSSSHSFYYIYTVNV